jgi:hypothetical protein
MTRSGHRLPVRPPGESTERIVAAAARAEASAAVRAEGVERADLSVIGGATAASASTPTGTLFLTGILFRILSRVLIPMLYTIWQFHFCRQ